MASLESVKNAPMAYGIATIMAIGTAVPPNAMDQSSFADFYFRVHNREHMVDLKKKMQHICEKTAIQKRHFVWNKELLAAHPCLRTVMEPSFNVRQEVMLPEIPRLGAEAAKKAIEEWGQPKSRITHLIFCTTSGMDLPGADFHLHHLLGLNPDIQRVILYQQGCFAGGTVLRLAKCLAESRRGARVLVVCAETTTSIIRAPSPENPGELIVQSLFADGASAMVVGADTDKAAGERSFFDVVSASQTILPDSSEAIMGKVGEAGIAVMLSPDVPRLVSENLEKCLDGAFGEWGVSDWNSIFWVIHPGGRAILDRVEESVGLRAEKLLASRRVLAEYGNMSSVSVHFVLDEMRRRSAEEGKATTGEGFEWGVLFGFGPGITVETVVLRSVPI